MPRLPKPTGPFGVGTRDVFIPPERNSTDNEMTRNGLIVKLWFPTELALTKRAPYMNPQYYKSFAKVTAETREMMIRWVMNKVRTNSCTTEMQLDSKQLASIPILIFSHGLYASPHLYSALAEDAASHGYFVIAPYHTDGSAFEVIYPNAHHIPFRVLDFQGEERSLQLKERVGNISFLIDWLEKRLADSVREPTNELDRFLPYLDLQRIFIMGHSFGGGTALEAFVEDHRIVAGICLDGWFTPCYPPIPNVHARYRRRKGRFLFLDSDLWQTDENREARNHFLTLGSGALNSKDSFFLQVIPTSTHYSFSDVAIMVPRVGGWKKKIPQETAAVSREIRLHILRFLHSCVPKQGRTTRILTKIKLKGLLWFGRSNVIKE